MKAFIKTAKLTAIIAAAAASAFAAQPKSGSGSEGRDSFIATSYMPAATTGYHLAPLSSMFSMCNSAIQWNNRTFMVGDRNVRVNLNWIRDYVLTLKSMRYVEPEIKSFPDILLENQTPEGFFFEIIAPVTDGHSGAFVRDDCRKVLPDTDFGLCRLEIEADVEYLMVEGLYLIWQATGDDAYLRKNLPRVEKGIEYIMTNPKRWDKSLGLAKRPYTIDTWDFLNRASSQTDRSIHPDDPMGIMHGDNTGLYQAQTLLSKMFAQIGDNSRSEYWLKESEALKERINKTLWNGEFYKHYVMIDKVDYGVDMEKQLSLSNAYDINRGTATPEMARSVIESYRAMRKKYGGEFDDFRTLEPAFPEFKGLKAGTYTNGAIGFFIAGELAVSAFENGMEDYGVDILYRVGKKVSKDGKMSFLYDYTGEDRAGGPRCWIGSEMMFALTRGLAGVVDNGALFKDVTISPRFVAADEKRAHVFLKYRASDAHIEYKFSFDKSAEKIGFELVSKHDKAKLRMLLPAGTEAANLEINGKPAESKIEDVFGSKYLVCESFPSGGKGVISYEKSVDILATASINSDCVWIYILNNSKKPEKCVVSFSGDGWKSKMPREFEISPSESRRIEILPIVRDANLDGAPAKVTIARGGKTFKFPISKIVKAPLPFMNSTLNFENVR